MPSVSSDSGRGALVPICTDSHGSAVYPLRHCLKSPISRLSVSWSRCHYLRVSVFTAPSSVEDDAGGKIVEVKLSGGDDEKNAVSSLSKISMNSSPYDVDWWDYIMEYSKDINALLGGQKSDSVPVIDYPKMKRRENGEYVNLMVKLEGEEPTSLKAAWELLEMFYAEKPSHSWLPERLVDRLADYDSLFSGTYPILTSLYGTNTVLEFMLVVENNPKYWEVMSSTLAVGWLDIVGLENMYSLAQKSIQLKPMASAHKLMGLIIEILGENTEVVLAECLKGFGPW
ncbi:Regulator of chromosome condensation family protein isoform 1 [Hibiscus syriacus]|uniref:Nuclear pore complex protein Nup85 n=1 Tax=Hibiscus syriacus TaxID=106335 RepID=A0A6A2YCW2_HIBSY|nr:Regulator of chromosome condensation family protein isoform 1 [Hibiscus syriacus]